MVLDDTLAWLAENGDPVEYHYLSGHRRRLATTLTMIPKAPHPDASLIDVGCYGYMAYWAHRYLGYARVEGIELRPDCTEAVIERQVCLCEDSFTFRVLNIDIAKAGWTMPRHDTALLLETLEHVNEDPSGVLERIAAGLPEGGCLVTSVPNAISYKTLTEILMGAPPWTYWFFHPDLRHEPRHAFEYTPTFFAGLLRAAGFRMTAFRTIVSYAERESLDDIFALGRALSIEERFFGETMITHTVKESTGGVIRYPDMIYDGDAYYRSTWPQLAPRGRNALASFSQKWGANLQELRQAEAATAAEHNRMEAAEAATTTAEAATAAAWAERTEALAMALAVTGQIACIVEKADKAEAALSAERDRTAALERDFQTIVYSTTEAVLSAERDRTAAL